MDRGNIRFGMDNFRQAQRKFRGINCDQHIWILRDNIVRRFIQPPFQRGYCFRISTIPMTDNSCIANRLSIPRAIIRGPATPMKSAGCSGSRQTHQSGPRPVYPPMLHPRLMRFSCVASAAAMKIRVFARSIVCWRSTTTQASGISQFPTIPPEPPDQSYWDRWLAYPRAGPDPPLGVSQIRHRWGRANWRRCRHK